MDMTRRGFAVLLFMVLLLANRPAAADERFVTGFGGTAFRATTGFIDVDQGIGLRKRAFGGGAAWVSDRWLGCEGEVTLVPALFDGGSGLVTSSRALGVHANLLVTSPRRFGWRVRPYATLGAGAIDIRTNDVADVFTTRATLPALNAGGGMIVRVGSGFGVRGDLRYFQTTFRDPPAGRAGIGSWYLQFWRASAGLVVRF